ncbi:transcription initiation factor IIA subunit 1-like [Paramuricea clavata]|nr:transcription initiation factor IIA subunit 1-like [Paramuricea clavata]
MQPAIVSPAIVNPAIVNPAIVNPAPVPAKQQGQHFITTHPQYMQQPHGQYHTTTQIMVPGTSITTIPQQIPQTSQTNQQPIRPAYHGLSVSAIQPTHQTMQPTHQTMQPTHQTMQNLHNPHVTTQQQTSRPSVIIQLDGPNDSDSDDDDDDDDFNDLSHDDDGEDKPQEDGDPLNSEDDVSDDDSSDLFDTDNVVVCQFDRITRSKNKWKFHLKDGIMNLNTKDYVFTKATGEAEW